MPQCLNGASWSCAPVLLALLYQTFSKPVDLEDLSPFHYWVDNASCHSYIHQCSNHCQCLLHGFWPLVCCTEFSGYCSIVPHTVLYSAQTTYPDHHKAGLIQWLTLKFTLLTMTSQALNPGALDPYEMLAFKVSLSLVLFVYLFVTLCWASWLRWMCGSNQNSHSSSAKGQVQCWRCRAGTKSNGKKYNSSIYGSILSILVPC